MNVRYDAEKDCLTVVLTNGPQDAGAADATDVIPIYDERGELTSVEIPRALERLTTSLEAADLPGHDDFWTERTVEELAAEQGVKPITRLDEVLGQGAALWDSDEALDDFLNGIRERRLEGF
ncbi:MAG: hypothetical protein KY476_01370 [Planctomycetes bacterium]|nr:hypothetical protein [Planctomycetota bacterium]